MVDSHCHLADAAFRDDRPTVVARAVAAGLVEALCVLDATDEDELAQAQDLPASWEVLRLAAGVHPHRAAVFAADASGAAERTRAVLAGLPSARAVGEIGLDYHYDFAPRDVQRAVFAAQVGLARNLGWPIVIHTREADEDTLDILRQEGAGQVGGVFHCFSGDEHLARKALDLGFYVSFSGIVTFPKAADVHRAARLVPDDRLLIETDCPYLAPVPHRGRRNEPAWVTAVAAHLGQLRQASAEHVGTCATANYRALFKP